MSRQKVGSSECLLADLTGVGSGVALYLEVKHQIARPRKLLPAIQKRASEAQSGPRASLETKFFNCSDLVLLRLLRIKADSPRLGTSFPCASRSRDSDQGQRVSQLRGRRGSRRLEGKGEAQNQTEPEFWTSH